MKQPWHVAVAPVEHLVLRGQNILRCQSVVSARYLLVLEPSLHSADHVLEVVLCENLRQHLGMSA